MSILCPKPTMEVNMFRTHANCERREGETMEWGGVGTGYGERGGEGKEADVGKGQVGRAGRHVPHVQINKYFLVF